MTMLELSQDYQDALTRIRELEAENARLRAALKPLACINSELSVFERWLASLDSKDLVRVEVSAGEVREARRLTEEALRKDPPPGASEKGVR